MNVDELGTISGSRRSMSAFALIATIEGTSLEVRKKCHEETSERCQNSVRSREE